MSSPRSIPNLTDCQRTSLIPRRLHPSPYEKCRRTKTVSISPAHLHGSLPPYLWVVATGGAARVQVRCGRLFTKLYRLVHSRQPATPGTPPSDQQKRLLCPLLSSTNIDLNPLLSHPADPFVTRIRLRKSDPKLTSTPPIPQSWVSISQRCSTASGAKRR